MILVNPKNGAELRTNLTEQQAFEICAKLKNNNFAQDLCRQHAAGKGLSPGKYYWFFKLAEDNQPIEPIQLKSDLQEFVSHVPLMQFKLEMDDKTYGKVLLRTREDCVTVHACYRYQGKIIGDKFHYVRGCPISILAELSVMSVDPYAWMLVYGKVTGQCCVCGRELTNEDSVKYGIGPICREKFGF